MKEIFERVSVRSYTDQPVEAEKIEDILRAGMCAPSAGNERPWHFVVLKDPKDFLPLMQISEHLQMLPQAKYVIMVCGDTTQKRYRFDFWVQDCCAALENMLIEAKHLGLGAVWCGIYPDTEKIIRLCCMYGLPETVEVLALMPIGYPAIERKVHDRYKSDRVHIGRWENVLRDGATLDSLGFSDKRSASDEQMITS
ncbi:MAG: nitroreductase family protein [Firmicutes bacterium]|jgi:nitroreductase|nr:nitroreductase family protein [Bacillota bacterium]